MKTFRASDLAHKRAEIFEAAREEGAIIERRSSGKGGGDVLESFMLVPYDPTMQLRDNEGAGCEYLGLAPPDDRPRFEYDYGANERQRQRVKKAKRELNVTMSHLLELSAQTTPEDAARLVKEHAEFWLNEGKDDDK